MEKEVWTFLGLAKDSWTLIGAGIAGFTGLWNFVWQWRDRYDSIYVGLDSLRQSIEPHTSLYVINQSKHAVELHNFGLILKDGSLFSIPWYWEENMVWEEDPSSFSRGERTMPPRATYEAGMAFSGEVIGRWAITATQKRPTLVFTEYAGTFNQLWIRLRTKVSPRYT